MTANATAPSPDKNPYLQGLSMTARAHDHIPQQYVVEAWQQMRCARIEAGLFLADRAERNHTHYWDCMMQYRSSPLERELERLGSITGEEVTITDEARHAEAMDKLSEAAEAKRSELALLGSGYARLAANGDPLGKLSRYKTASFNRLRRLRAELAELQAERKRREEREAATPPAAAG